MLEPKHMRQLSTLQVFVKQRGDFTVGSRTANLFLESWVSLHHHLVVQGRLGPCPSDSNYDSFLLHIWHR